MFGFLTSTHTYTSDDSGCLRGRAACSQQTRSALPQATNRKSASLLPRAPLARCLTCMSVQAHYYQLLLSEICQHECLGLPDNIDKAAVPARPVAFKSKLEKQCCACRPCEAIPFLTQ